MTSPALCPHCGYDLIADRVMEHGGLRLDPRAQRAWWRDVEVHLSCAEFVLLFALVKGSPACVAHEVLAERLGYEGDDPSNILKVYVSRVRSKARGLPIKTIWGRGYAWRPI